MKQILPLLIICISFKAYSQFSVNVVNVTTNDLVYDSNTDRIYTSIPSSNGANGNSLGVINPNTYTLENTIFIGSEPTVLALSDNGQFIYSGFSGASLIRRFEVATQTAGLQFSLGSDPSTGSFYAEDIEVLPGSPNTIAVSRKNNGFSPRHEGVVIYDDNIMRSTTTQDHTGSNKIEFKDNTNLFGYNNETTEFGLRSLSVNASGISEGSVNQNILSGFGVDFIYNNNYIYATNGKVIDVTGVPFAIGEFLNASGPMVYDTNLNLVCYASYDFSGNITFKRFNPNTFLLVDSYLITQASGDVNSITTCGNGCYVFNTSDNKVIIINDTNLSVHGYNSVEKINIYPNPTTDYLYFDETIDSNSIEVFDINGRKLNLQKTNNRISFINLNSGIYIVRIKIKRKIITKKIIKK
jgi:hypothetical protein